VGVIAPKLEQAEIERAKHQPTESLDAYDHYLRGIALLHQWSRETQDQARSLFYKAIELDPNFASAHGLAAFCGVVRKTNGWMTDIPSETAEIARLARRAVELGRDNAVALCRGGHALAYVVGDLEGGAGLIDLALTLDPNMAVGWYSSGWIRAYLGETDMAIQHLTHAMQLSPVDLESNQMQTGIALAYFVAGRYDEACSWAQKALREKPNYTSALRIVAASSALAGRLEEARHAAEHLHQMDPKLRVSNLRDRLPFRRPDDLARYEEGLRSAGLPEQ
jgi:tetratricopeptide (TPR) repeat protein